MSNLAYWKHFWGSQISPMHRYNSIEWYERYAVEINLLIKSLKYDFGPVLESGCGNGALFDFLEVNKEGYTGVDISETMLAEFRKTHSNTTLYCSDAGSFFDKTKEFSLIFSNQCCQYFDFETIGKYVLNSYQMLQSGGVLLIGNIPWKDNQPNFDSGELGRDISLFSFRKKISSILFKRGKKDSIGNWYNPRDFIGYQRSDFKISVFGSLFHPYRFSIAFKKG